MKAEIYESELYQEQLKEKASEPIVRKIWLDGLTYQCMFIQEPQTWEEISSYLRDLNTKNKCHWQLPTLSELEKLLTKIPLKNLKGETHYIHKSFLDFMPKESIFWSRTKENRFGIWVVDFSRGYYCLRDKSEKHYFISVSKSKLSD